MLNPFIKQNFSNESLGGFLLIFAAIIALILDNSPLNWLYDSILSVPVAIQAGSLIIHKPLLLWINDGLMAIFFFLIGLEIKREFIQGELSSVKKASLPLVAALGGLVVPALIYIFFNYDDPALLKGWGIPVATDIAFALGVLALLGSRIPANLKILLLALAIIDDICGILIIAIFYTADLSAIALILAATGLLAAILLNRFGVKQITPYILIGVFMWVCVLKSGVHATLAGVVLALTIPLHGKEGEASPLKTLEHSLHPWVAFFIMPVFAFTNAGVYLGNISMDMLSQTVPLGIMLGLFVGKPVGVVLFVSIAIALKFCSLPKGVKWGDFLGLSFLCGIGFTMSLFIGSLAFESGDALAQVRIAILIASTASAVLGYSTLQFVNRNK